MGECASTGHGRPLPLPPPAAGCRLLNAHTHNTHLARPAALTDVHAQKVLPAAAALRFLVFLERRESVLSERGRKVGVER